MSAVARQTITLDAWRPTPQRDPFPHLEFGPGEALSEAVVLALLEAFPHHQMPGIRRAALGTDKRYVTEHLVLFDERRDELAAVDGIWLDLVQTIAGAQYRQLMAESLELARPFDLEIRLTSYPVGGWMSTHTDRDDKSFSQNIYLCPDWNPRWGGGLALFRQRGVSMPTRLILPSAGNSVAFRRSPHSWHAVNAVHACAQVPRRAILVHGYHRSIDGTTSRDGANAPRS